MSISEFLSSNTPEILTIENDVDELEIIDVNDDDLDDYELVVKSGF